MDWMEDIRKKSARKNRLMFSRDSAFLEDLSLCIAQQSHRTLVLWALDLAKETVDRLETKYPGEYRPRNALRAAEDWAAGRIKMPIAQREILTCHALAGELSIAEDIALCHAVGQACSVVHTPRHALGYPIYDLTAIVFTLGVENCRDALVSRKQLYIDKLLFWQKSPACKSGPWAAFLRA